MQTWPVVVYAAAASWSASASVIARSGARTAASLPPSSSSTGVSWSAAALMTARPVDVPPVNETRSIPGCATSRRPRSGLGPESTLTTPGGSVAANSASTRSTVNGQVGGTLTTVVLPAASAGPSFVIETATGQLNGKISAATPYGSRCTRGYAAGASMSSGASALSAMSPSS